MDPVEAAGQRLLLAFEAKEVTPQVTAALESLRPAGITLFRSLNIDSPGQLRRFTGGLQRAASDLGLEPLLIAADQEGGQLMAIGEGVTPLPGNMALGAAGSAELARQAGEVLGQELAAMGVNVNYAPSCDVNINPGNPVIGTRSFGEEPASVARLAAAMIAGIQSAGVAAAAKHFPGHGDTDSDSHYGLPVVPHELERLLRVELPPFQAAVAAQVRMVMTAHLALPALDGPQAPPATLSRQILTGLLREQLGFEGVVVTDAMDMQGVLEGMGVGEAALRAARAGADLLLLTSGGDAQRAAHQALADGLRAGKIDPLDAAASAERVRSLKDWLSRQVQPDMSVVGCRQHLAAADEIARRSVTLVRDQAGLLPLRAVTGRQITAVLPRPVDLTPADTSSHVRLALADHLRRYDPGVAGLEMSYEPAEEEIAVLLERIRSSSLLILGTLNAGSSPGQAEFVRRALALGIPAVVAALRLPYDLAAFPQAETYACTYSIQEPSMRALAAALFGVIPFQGRLPVSIPGLYPLGHGLFRPGRQAPAA